jgi:hypothetical protein
MSDACANATEDKCRIGTVAATYNPNATVPVIQANFIVIATAPD